jgi:hypothetical protein
MTLALPPIDDSLVRYDAGAPEFEQLVSSILGNAADSSDGWDADLAAVMALFSATDDAVASLDPVMTELGLAMDAFDLLDVSSVFNDALAQVPALGSYLDNLKLAAVGGLTLGTLPPPPGGGAPVTPPTVCVPAPGPAPGPAPEPSPPPSKPCPDGYAYSFTTQQCEPVAAPAPPGVPPINPPIPLPPLPIGLPPCPPGTAFVPGQPCKPTDDTGDSTTKYVLAIGNQILTFATAQEMTTAAVGWVTSFGLTAFAAIPIAGAIIAVGALIFSFMGGGCGEACIDASKIEQVYEAVGTNLLALARIGMLGGYAAFVAIQHFLQAGHLAEARLGTIEAQRGATNLMIVLANLGNAAKLLPHDPTQPLDIAVARTHYAGGPGWYPDSIKAANQLTDQWLVGLGAQMPA